MSAFKSSEMVDDSSQAVMHIIRLMVEFKPQRIQNHSVELVSDTEH